VCQPWIFAQAPVTSTPTAVATDGSNVIWADTGLGKVEQLAVSGGGAIALATSGVGSILSLNSSKVLYGTGNSLGVASVGSANSGTTLGSLPAPTVYAAALGGGGSRYIMSGSIGTTNVWDCPVGGGTCGSASTTTAVSSLVADNSYAFYIDVNHVFQESLGSGTFTSVVTHSPAPVSLALDGNFFYFIVPGASGHPSALDRLLESTPTSIQSVTSSVVAPYVSDGTNVYFPSGAGTEIQFAPAAGGGSPTNLAPTPSCSAIAVGGKLLVWISGSNIYALALQ
jgi:hypothetical protein